jgi:hypothetical protein
MRDAHDPYQDVFSMEWNAPIYFLDEFCGHRFPSKPRAAESVNRVQKSTICRPDDLFYRDLSIWHTKN